MRTPAVKHVRVRVEILVQNKPKVPNPEGTMMKHKLSDIGLPVMTVTTGKYFQVDFENMTLRQVKRQAPQAARKLLINPHFEKFKIISIKPVES